VAIVAADNVNSSGNGTISIFSQNFAGTTNVKSLAVSGWSVAGVSTNEGTAGYVEWLPIGGPAPTTPQETAFQAASGYLYTSGIGGDPSHGKWTQPGQLAPNSSPSIAKLSSGQYEVAFQGGNGDLDTINLNTGADKDWGLGMMAGTSPAITALGSSYEVAFQANNGLLYTEGALPHGKWSLLTMKPGTSPSIMSSNGAYEVAYQGSDGNLYTLNGNNTSPSNWGLGMMAGTSPSIAPFGSSFEVAFQANTGYLYTVGFDNHASWGLGVMKGTSPSIAANNGTYQVAFQANQTGSLYSVTNSAVKTNWKLGMAGGTSPAITADASGYEMSFQSGGNGSVWTEGSGGDSSRGSWGLGVMKGTSPSITR
jgi:hypothetical protein